MQVITSTGDAAAGQDADLVWHRFDTGRLCYNEALHRGRYVGAGFSAMGRLLVHDHLRNEIVSRPGLVGAIPWHKRASSECAFVLEIDGILLDGHWAHVSDSTDRNDDRLTHRVVLAHRVGAELFTIDAGVW
jgi:hypothetical protein